MKFPLLLVLLLGGVSALHLRSETSDFESPLGEETSTQELEMTGQEVRDCASGELPLPEEEVEEGSGGEGTPEEEGAVQSSSAIDTMDFQCPKEEDTVKLVGGPECKSCRFIVVNTPMVFDNAQAVCRQCYRGSLISIHNLQVNLQIQCSVRAINWGQVWIGARSQGWGHCRRFHWVDGSCWNFTHWACGEPQRGNGGCVALCTRGGHWRTTPCHQRLPFICAV